MTDTAGPTLVEFIEARLAEDAAAVEAVRAHVPRYEHAHHYELALRIARGRASTAIHVPMWERLGTDRVLRGVEAKRAVVDLYETVVAQHEQAMADYEKTGSMSDSHEVIKAGSKREALRDAVLFLASEWDTHEDYQAEWRP